MAISWLRRSAIGLSALRLQALVRGRRRTAVTVSALAVVLGLVIGWAVTAPQAAAWHDAASAPVTRSPASGARPGPVYRIEPTTAVALLATLPIKGRAPKTGYAREAFGLAWTDVDGNGCDTRNDVLRRDLKNVTLVTGSLCLVAAGTLDDPYTGNSIDFQRGANSSAAVQIDHVVALGDAWQKGAQQLSLDQRLALANDPLNLMAVDGPSNQKKSDGDAATWLPPEHSFRCAYVARQISVKAAYGLWITTAEHDAMASILRSCPGQSSLSSGL
ncbi:HNH endonuclease family protein [Psychromicrobium xiongbiense]|uniref:HNH endonuclease family protein n=1 Tax=Psychromicrobium xiongbiense TaxID=3051184 RepID=UPI002556692F|nr:HNH endonuclease family protein [Psychromicrobium sp. YIM S02556]